MHLGKWTLNNGGITSVNGYTTLVSVTSNEHVTLLSPIDSPLIADDPVRNFVHRSVSNDDHLVIEAVVIGQAGGIAKNSAPEYQVNRCHWSLYLKLHHLLVRDEMIRDVIGGCDWSFGHQSSLDGRFILWNVSASISKFGVGFGFWKHAGRVLSGWSTGVSVSTRWLLPTYFVQVIPGIVMIAAVASVPWSGVRAVYQLLIT